MALTRSVDPRTGALLNTAAQHHGYQLFDGAWVHARHSKYVRMALAATNGSSSVVEHSGVKPARRPNQTSTVISSEDLQHPKQAYMRGLVDTRLRLHAPRRARSGKSYNSSDHAEKPALWRLPSGRDTPPWLAMTRELWEVVAAGRPLDLVLPDNAYMMGAVDGAFRFFEGDMHQDQRREAAEPPCGM